MFGCAGNNYGRIVKKIILYQVFKNVIFLDYYKKNCFLNIKRRISLITSERNSFYEKDVYLLLYCDGEKIYETSGYLDEEELLNLIKETFK